MTFEGDCKKMIDMLNSKILHFDVYNWVREMRSWKNKFDNVDFL